MSDVELERVYNIRIRQRIVKIGTPRPRRKNRAIKYIREFIARHMHVDDPKKVKLDGKISEKIFSVGKGKLPTKLSLKAIKFKDGTVRVELLEQ